MALTDERYAEIDAELQRVRDYLAELAIEIDTASAYKYGATYTSAIHALGALTGLRHMLASDQEYRKINDEIQRRLDGGK
jgi:hypothetical protein